MRERAGIINGEKREDGLQGRLWEKGKLHHGNRGGCKARMEKLKIEAKVFEGADADVGTSGSRGSGSNAGGVSGEKTAEGLNSRCGVKALQNEGCPCLSRKGEWRAGAPSELGKLLEQGQLRERCRASDGEGRKSIAENAE